MEKISSKKRAAEPQRQEQSGGLKQSKSMATNVTVDLQDLDCPICLDPLRPPVLQCALGHLICSSCHEGLQDKDKCYYCNITTVYNRCFAIEHILGSLRVPCSNSIYGCTAKTAYNEKEEHKKKCPHAPCFCPEARCGFAGSTDQLLEHFTAEHQWQSDEIEYGDYFSVQVQEEESTPVFHCDDGHLFLLKFTPAEPFGIAISVICIGPDPARPKFKCRLRFCRFSMDVQQNSTFSIRSTNLSDGLPEYNYTFVVPKVSHPSTSITVSIKTCNGNA